MNLDGGCGHLREERAPVERNTPGECGDCVKEGLPGCMLLPVSAPWCMLAEVMDFAKAVGAPRSLPVHDRILSDVGLAVLDDRVSAYLEGIGDYHRVPDGADLPT